MRLCSAALLTILLIAPAAAQEQGDWTSSFARVEGGAVFEYREGVDGTLVSEAYMLTRVICFDGNTVVHVMVPAGPEDDATVFKAGGEKSTLKKHSDTVYRANFRANGKPFHRGMELRPVNDKASHYKHQFVFPTDYGGRLWKAMLKNDAIMLIGTGGMPVSLPDDPKLAQALKSCGMGG